MHLLQIIVDKSHYVQIDRFMFHKTKPKNKKFFCNSGSQCFSSKNVLTEHKEVCLSINGAQSVRLEKGTINIKQVSVPFKIYADFQCNLESVESYEGSHSKKHQHHISCSFTYKLVSVDDKFTKSIVVFCGKNAAYEFIKEILKECQYCKKVMEKQFNKNLIKSEEEKQFQSSNTCWICEKLNDDEDEKVRDHCHVTGKFRGASHWSSSIINIF